MTYNAHSLETMHLYAHTYMYTYKNDIGTLVYINIVISNTDRAE